MFAVVGVHFYPIALEASQSVFDPILQGPRGGVIFFWHPKSSTHHHDLHLLSPLISHSLLRSSPQQSPPRVAPRHRLSSKPLLYWSGPSLSPTSIPTRAWGLGDCQYIPHNTRCVAPAMTELTHLHRCCERWRGFYKASTTCPISPPPPHPIINF